VIGVLCKPGQRHIVEEFFELFKTPWEYYEDDRVYDVIVATTGTFPSRHRAKVVLLFGADACDCDVRFGLTTLAPRQGGWVNGEYGRLPIYGSLIELAPHETGAPCLSSDHGVAGLRIESDSCVVFRIAYDLFDESSELLSTGQPTEQAHVPTLDLHIALLRSWIVNAGVELIEIPPIPAMHPFVVCLTHDIDFIGIRQHLFDHSMWGFLYRATIGAVWNFMRGRVSAARLLRMWCAAASLPFVFLGWVQDFWEPFDWYLRVEHGLPATYFLIPFKRRGGDRLRSVAAAHRRGTAYDISDLRDRAIELTRMGYEVGVHGIDAWHSSDRGRSELARIAEITGGSMVGIRMHWLLHDRDTASILDEAGYSYDSTSGYNETIGYRNGTTQVFRPLESRVLVELPMHIQDGALFFADKLNVSESEAWTRCSELITRARDLGGVLTLLWHDRSHGPERFWGDFYAKLIQELRSSGAWFATGAQTVCWFERRRRVRFGQVGVSTSAGVRGTSDTTYPPLRVRVHRPFLSPSFVDIIWDGVEPITLESPVGVGAAS
jgi:hypothetical protein